MGRPLGLGIAAALAAVGGCELDGSSYAFVERDDVILSVPAPRLGGDGPRGEAHALVATSATELDGFVGDVVANIVDAELQIADHRETRREGAFSVYGPFDDLDDRDLAWLVKIEGDDEASRFEVWVGPRGTADESALSLVLHGEIDDDERRTGDVTLDYTVIDGFADLRPAGEHLAGGVSIAFDRALDDGDARIEMVFDDFVREGDDVMASPNDEPLVHTRDASGGGTLRAKLDVATTPPPGVLADLAVARVDLDLRWDASAAGRARARAAAPRNPESALPHGDLLVHECFDGGGGLTFRALNEPYAVARPSYAFGDAASCVFADSDLDTP